MLAQRTGFLLVGILAMVSLGVLVGIRVTGTQAGGATTAYAVLVKQAPFKSAGLVILDTVNPTKMKIVFSAYSVKNAGTHPAHIHDRQPGAQCNAGRVAIDFNKPTAKVNANANGIVSFSKTMTGKVGEVVGKIVVLHDLDGKYMACGPIKVTP